LAFVAPLGVIGATVLVGACTTNSLTAKGGACFQSIDCQDGLVCIPTPGADAGGTCSDDLSSIVSTPEAGSDAPVTTDATTDGTAPDTSVPDTSVPDTSVPDTSVPDTSVPDTSVPDTSVPDAATD
jgi:hypothetical protein